MKTCSARFHAMRKAVEARLFDLCAAVQEIIENHEAEALNAAIEEVANRLTTFLEGNRRLGAREKLAYAEALSTVRGVRYGSTLWAATRRKGEYTGLNINPSHRRRRRPGCQAAERCLVQRIRRVR